MVLCAKLTTLSIAISWSAVLIACVKTNVEAHETIQNCGLVYFIDREKLHQLTLWQEFVQNKSSDQIFISGEMVFQITLATLQ